MPILTRSHLHLASRYTVAAGLAYAIALMFHLPQGYWSVITAMAIMQGSLGGTLTAGGDRVLGTLLGAASGALAATLNHFTDWPVLVLLCLAIAPMGLAAALKPGLRIAPLTAAIIVLAGNSNISPLVSALHRVIEIAIGTVVGIGVSLIVFPVRAHQVFADWAAKALLLLADLFDLYAAAAHGQADHAATKQLAKRIRTAIAAVEVAAAESEREHVGLLAGEPVLQVLAGQLRHLRSDLVIVGRILTTPLPETVAREVGPALDELRQAVRRILAGAAESLRNGNAVPGLESYDAARELIGAALGRLQASGSSAEATLPGESRLSALPFAVGNLRKGLADLLGALAAFKRDA